MAGQMLTTSSQVQCPHGGQATLITGNARVSADSGQVLLQTDVHPIAGCPFTIGTKPSPCLRIEWTVAAAQVTVDGTPVLDQSSVGLCLSPENAPQGVAIIVNTQQKASAR